MLDGKILLDMIDDYNIEQSLAIIVYYATKLKTVGPGSSVTYDLVNPQGGTMMDYNYEAGTVIGKATITYTLNDDGTDNFTYSERQIDPNHRLILCDDYKEGKVLTK